jgi:RhtB (resistance to homoserine/threonine) family protein
MDNLLAYLSIATMMVMIPGADTMLLIKNTLSYGTKAGYYTVFGMATGLTFWTLIAVLGLAVVIANSAFLFNTIKYLGAAYLIYLGVKNFFAKSVFSLKGIEEGTEVSAKSLKHHNKESFRQAFLSNILNPKTVLVYVTVMPQFIDVSTKVNQQLIILAALLTLIAIVWYLILISIMNYAKKWLNDANFQKIFQKVSGLILIAFGVTISF